MKPKFKTQTRKNKKGQIEKKCKDCGKWFEDKSKGSRLCKTCTNKNQRVRKRKLTGKPLVWSEKLQELVYVKKEKSEKKMSLSRRINKKGKIEKKCHVCSEWLLEDDVNFVPAWKKTMSSTCRKCKRKRQRVLYRKKTGRPLIWCDIKKELVYEKKRYTQNVEKRVVNGITEKKCTQCGKFLTEDCENFRFVPGKDSLFGRECMDCLRKRSRETFKKNSGRPLRYCEIKKELIYADVVEKKKKKEPVEEVKEKEFIPLEPLDEKTKIELKRLVLLFQKNKKTYSVYEDNVKFCAQLKRGYEIKERMYHQQNNNNAYW